MPRPVDPAVRERLIDEAVDLLAAGEEVTLRKVATAARTSTMGVYTHFDGMPGLMLAVRERAFGELAENLLTLHRPTADPVADLVSCGQTYAWFGLDEPALYQTMFDLRRDRNQPVAASMTFAVLVAAVERAQAEGRLTAKVDGLAAATRLWAMTHGVVMLVLNGALPEAAIDEHLPPMYVAQLVAWGDGPRKAPASVRRGWRRPGS